MGNGLGRMGVCFVGAAGDSPLRPTNNYSLNMYISDPCDEGLGHSFCYVRPDPSATTMSMTTTPSSSFSSKVLMEDTTTSALFRSISGASVSANTSTALSTSYLDDCSSAGPVSSAFESSTSFTSMPLQPLPRSSVHSGPLTGPIEPGFMSGPIDRGFLSGPLDRAAGGGSSLFSGPLERGYSRNSTSFLRRSLSHSGWTRFRHRSIRPGSMIRGLGRSISRKLSRGQSSIVAPVKGLGSGNKYRESWVVGGGSEKKHDDSGCLNPCGEKDASDMCAGYDQNLFQWAQGRAGEDRVLVVVSEEHNWVFVGIYDGFSGPDATDFLLSNLYSFVMKELKGLLWDDRSSDSKSLTSPSSTTNSENGSLNLIPEGEGQIPFQCRWVNHSNETNPPIPYSVTQDSNPELNTDSSIPRRKRGRNLRIRRREGTARRRWKYEWDRERIELDRRLKEHSSRLNGTLNSKTTIDHSDVLKALSRALKKTEEAYFDIADKMLDENPELALMGSCVLAMLIKGEDVYVMNVGDSRAVLGQKTEPDLGFGKIDQDLERINEETLYDLEVSSDASVVRSSLCAVQLTMEHSTYVQKEVKRIRDEHPDDPFVISNDRVKGALKLTRAFGAGFLKQRKWNDELLKMFRIDYVGTSPYLNCLPSLHHHRLSPKDKFLILSSDGLYQYFTIEEAVSEVELFVSMSPEGDPAQHLVEEVLLRAAKRAGMDFYELLTIPQGERRRYHDDVSIIVISFEGRIWRSSCVRMSFPEEKPGE